LKWLFPSFVGKT